MSESRLTELTPLTITLVYVAVGGVWVAFSDRLLAAMLGPGPLFATLSTGKGWVFVTGSGLLIYGLTVGRDRQLRETSALLDESRQQLSILHRVLRHNLRNYCTIIRASSDLIEEDIADERAVAHLRRTTDKLVAISEKSRHLKSMLDRNGTAEVVDVAARVEDIVADLESDYPDADIQTHVPETATAAVDSHFEVALSELVTNAVEHHDADDPTVWISIEDDQSGGIRLDVADDGPGIPEMEREVLEAGIEKPMFHSQGLGLWIVRVFVQRSGGQVRVIDNEPRGSLVRLRLPGTVDGTVAAR